jgi:hypothetical protein
VLALKVLALKVLASKVLDMTSTEIVQAANPYYAVDIQSTIYGRVAEVDECAGLQEQAIDAHAVE